MTGTFPLLSDATSFIGRRAELHEIRQLLERSRAVILIGPGGVGKTRLATQAATAVKRAFATVWFVSLGSAGPADAGVALGLSHSGGRIDATSVARRIAELAGDQNALLVLDGCEHRAEECGELIDRLLVQVPAVSVLATSRRALPTAGAVSWPVPPLRLPRVTEVPPSVVEVGHSDGVALFVERAATVYPAFLLTDQNVGAVARLCARVDGLPLAIEMAAAHMRTMSAEQLLERLDPRFRLLGAEGGVRAELSLWETVAQTYADCSEAEQAVWAAASVFEGGFSLDDVEAVCAQPGSDPVVLARTVAGLVDHTVFTDLRENNGRIEYRLLNTFKQFGREQLETHGLTVAARARHEDWISALAHETEPFWMGSDAVDKTDRLLRHHADIAAVLGRYLAEGRPRDALRLAVDLRVHWMAANRLAEGISWIEKASDAADATGALAAETLWTTAYLAVLDGRQEWAAQLLDRGRRLAVELDSPLVEAHCQFVDGLAAWSEGKATAAASRLEAAFRAYVELGARPHRREALFILGMVLATRGTSALSVDLIDTDLAEMGGDLNWWGRGYVWWLRGFAAVERGDIDEAGPLLRQCINHMRSHNDRTIVWWCLELLAWIAAEHSEFRLAAQLFGSAHAFGPHVMPLVVRERHDRYLAATSRALGAAVTEKLRRKGAGLGFDQAIELAAGTADSPAPSGGGADGTEQLTEREMQVARLVAYGQSNKEIAAALVISARTAEGHVQRILAKRGFTSRAQIAAWVGEIERIKDGGE
ncbi:LuxR C-terminal-related transcriptional regulator [Nocardia sp. NPDC004860]|uniref:ATP-binding protein n=1 Tax=Nocardia sp. NPDC004860 TaxID=3154557 RepID=UPI0033A13E52